MVRGGEGQAALEDLRRAAGGPRAGPRALSPEYVSKVIACLHADEASSDAERRREVAEQEMALRRLQRVLMSRLDPYSPPSSSSAARVAFDAGLDDDEALLLMMQEVDEDGSGAVSEAELLGASALLNPEMQRALASAFACDPEAVEEALAHLNAADFGDEYRVESNRAATGAVVFDIKSSARAVFDAAVREAEAGTQAGSAGGASESADGTAGVPSPVAVETAASGRATKACLERLADKANAAGLANLGAALAGLAKPLLGMGRELDFLAVKRAARRVPRVAGQRMEWVRTGVGLDAALARNLPPGTLDDGLAGVRAMPLAEAQRALAAFVEEAKVLFLEALLEAKSAKGSRSAAEANGKFDGFQGSFATLKDFHAGAEATLQLGYPNPDIAKGMRLEHTKHPSVERLFLTPNYRIVTSLLVEYVWAVLDKSTEPTDASLKEARQRALKLVRELVSARHGATAATATAPDDQLLFPGEVGDSFLESLVILRIPGSTADPAVAKDCKDAVKLKATELLRDGEEKVRGVATLGHQECLERIRRGASVLQSEPSGGLPEAEDGSLRVGVLLPMSKASADVIRDELAAAVGRVGTTAEVVGCRTWVFSQHTGVEELQKWLEERSLAELEVLAGRPGQMVPDADGGPAAKPTHAALCSQVAASFVSTELREDFLSTFESNASDAQIEALLTGWGVRPDAERAGRINQAAAAFDTDPEQRWREVERWVRLHRGRIQGRTRLGLQELVAREAAKIKLCGLTESEVLGLFLCTGGFISSLIPMSTSMMLV